MKKKAIILMLFIGILPISSCLGKGVRSTILTSDKEMAYKRMELILDAVKMKDKAALKAMFSKQALRETEDIDGSSDYLFNLFQGEILSWEKRGGLITDEKNRNGHKVIELKSFFSVKTENHEYLVFLLEYLEDTKNPGNIGLYTLRAINAEDEDEHWSSWQKMKKAGIYHP